MRSIALAAALLMAPAQLAWPQARQTAAPADVARMTTAQFNALPPGAVLAIGGKVLSKEAVLATLEQYQSRAAAWHQAEAAKEQAELAADMAALRSAKQDRLTRARAQLAPELARLGSSSAPQPGGAQQTREALQVKAALLVRRARDPSQQAAAEAEAKGLYEKLKGAQGQ